MFLKLRRARHLIFLFCVLLLAQKFSAQTYPVQATTILVPPFSGYLQDFANPTGQKLKLLLVFNDFNKPSYNVKIKFRLAGQNVSIQSKQFYFSGPITLTPGVPLELSGDDLAPILDDNNLNFSGINYNDYVQRKVLPEGFYTLCFTVYDNDNPLNIPVSAEACAFAWMSYCDPPFLNLPLCNSITPVTNPQQITFNWACGNAGCPSSIANTEYIFELFEIFPANQNPNNIVQSTIPIYTTTTQSTLFNYGITEPPLQFGREYCWRVKAKDVNGYDYFKNNGYSAVCKFTYGSNSGLLGSAIQLDLNAQAIRYNAAKFSWTPNNAFASYRLEYRKTGNSAWNWFGDNTTNASVVESDLEAITQYEARVRGIFANGDSADWSDVVNVTTPQKTPINCNDQSPAVSMQNFSALTSLMPNTKLQIGQFEMRVTSLQNTASPTGSYSGYGHVTMFGILNVHVQFTNILVGTDFIVYSGEVKAVSQGISNWVNAWQQNNFEYDTSYFYNGNIDTLYTDGNGNIVIVGVSGDTTLITGGYGNGALVTDSDGTQYVVNADGSVTPVTGAFLSYSTSPLSEKERSILKKALKLLKDDYALSTIENLKTTYETKKSAFNDAMSQRYSGLGLEYSETENQNSNAIVSEENSGFFVVVENKPGALNSTDQKHIDYKNAEFDLNVARIARAFARETNANIDIDLIGNYLKVETKTYRTFVADNLLQNKTEDEIAALVKEKGLVDLVKSSVKRKTTIK
ncbi:MAG: fibronectin type III domain-containing protein [Bacteroidia bacterium]|nr:fibronectin type III domain-containing protein [Bacteroidia bacterium]